ncbi:uncharacterized protein YALI1_C15516g [Yarrowia lipolytica]|uniref:Uncharacterized protein n=1 Tax=Yarrowia lipolytica TaxID=4952 RepID=A0A1D8NAL1_YARLL|nr:hypothetical protein YALI1_C15516g [Yarrowia lipolytica]
MRKLVGGGNLLEQVTRQMKKLDMVNGFDRSRWIERTGDKVERQLNGSHSTLGKETTVCIGGLVTNC